jgi:hypothetical protein
MDEERIVAEVFLVENLASDAALAGARRSAKGLKVEDLLG